MNSDFPANNNEPRPFSIECLRSNATTERLENIRTANKKTSAKKKAASEAFRKLTQQQLDDIIDPAAALVRRAADGDKYAVTQLVCLFGTAEARRRVTKFKKAKNK